MIAIQQQADRCCKTKPAVRPIRRKSFVTGIGCDIARQIVYIGKRVQTKNFITHTHLLGIHLDILQGGGVSLRKRKISFQYTGSIRRADDLIGGQRSQSDVSRIVYDLDKLIDRLQKPRYDIFVADFMRNDIAPAENGKITLLTTPFFCGFGNIQKRRVVQIRPLVKMQFKTAA